MYKRQLLPRPELTKEVRFDGHIDEWWDAGGFHHVEHRDATVVVAQALSLIHI